MPTRLYGDLASWWPLMSAPEDYQEEATFYAQRLLEAGDAPARTLLELDIGGGNNASFMKAHFEATLVDLSEGMLAVSRELNPECRHVAGDMRTLTLGRQFDRVFIHDAICYMTTAEGLRLAFETAYEHCRPGGAALFAPDHVRENFRPSTDDGGSDGEERSMRFLEWSWDPDPADTTCVTDFAFMVRERDGSVRVVRDRHEEGLFPRAVWLDLLNHVGFRPSIVPFDHSDLEPGSYELFLGVRAAA